MFIESRYTWRPISPIELKAVARKAENRIYCGRCDCMLLSKNYSMLTREPIWEYSLDDNVFGYAHEECAYGIEVEGIEANTTDSNYGKPPTEWE